MHWNLRVKLELLALGGATVALFAKLDQIFARLGYPAITQIDPQGPFVLGNVAHAVTAALLLLGVVTLTTLLGTLWLHRDLPGAAWVMIGAAWMGLALRSWPIDNRLMLLATPGDVHQFYVQLLAELGTLVAISGLVGLLANGLIVILPRPESVDTVPADRPADVEPPRSDLEKLLALSAHVFGTGVIAMVVYLVLLNSSPVGSNLPGPILRGQILFALAGGFFVGTMIMHQVFPTRNPWQLVLSVPAAAAICYLLTILMQAERQFDYQPPMRISAILPIDFLGMALPAVMAGFLMSYRLHEARHESSQRAAET